LSSADFWETKTPILRLTKSFLKKSGLVRLNFKEILTGEVAGLKNWAVGGL